MAIQEYNTVPSRNTHTNAAPPKKRRPKKVKRMQKQRPSGHMRGKGILGRHMEY